MQRLEDFKERRSESVSNIAGRGRLAWMLEDQDVDLSRSSVYRTLDRLELLADGSLRGPLASSPAGIPTSLEKPWPSDPGAGDRG